MTASKKVNIIKEDSRNHFYLKTYNFEYNLNNFIENLYITQKE